MRYYRISAVGLLLVLAGCGPQVAPVSGRVTLDGKALANATIIFQPVSGETNPGPGSKAKTDANGEFVLQLLAGETIGAIPGKHKVMITAYEGDGSIPSSAPGAGGAAFRKALLPDRYNGKSELTFEVPP